jgi:hypothetical protein
MLADVRFGSQADILEGFRDVRFNPNSGHRNSVVECPLCAKSGHYAVQQSGSLIDQLVGAGEQRCRDRETEGLGSPAIDYKLVLGRCLHRKVGRLFALENAIDVARCSAVLFINIRPVGD